MKRLRNWARTTICYPKDILYPTCEEEIVDIVRLCNQNQTPLKVVGKAHSYNDIFCPKQEGVLLSLKKFNQVEAIDTKNQTVIVQGGVRIPSLIKALKKEKLSLKNLGTNIFDTVAGACSTGYHGSGMAYGIFVSDILWMEVITPKGEKRRITKEEEDFKAYAVGLGMLGVIVRLCLECEPYYHLKITQQQLSLEEIEARFEEFLGYKHFKFIWIPHTDHFLVWLAQKTNEKESSLWHKLYDYGFVGIFINNFFHELLLFFASFKRNLVPKINRLMANLLLPKRGEKDEKVYAAHWAFFLPHVLKQDVVEYAFKIEDTFSVFRKIIAMIEEKRVFVDTPIEVRFVKKDDYWMSPTQGEDVCFIGTKIHFPYHKEPEYFRYFSLVDEILLAHNGRPHWGKQFRITKEDFQKNYPNWEKFWAFVDKQDPKALFANHFSKRLRS